jgi:hypothetical protein
MRYIMSGGRIKTMTPVSVVESHPSPMGMMAWARWQVYLKKRPKPYHPVV